MPWTGVGPEFTEAELRKQHRLLSLRYHPDAARRNGVEPAEAAERFVAMQTAYEVLSDPVQRKKYDIEQRRQRRREWRAAWPAPPPQLQHTVPELDLRSAGRAGGEAGAGAGAGAGAQESAPSPREARAKLAEEKADWLARQLELMTLTLTLALALTLTLTLPLPLTLTLTRPPRPRRRRSSPSCRPTNGQRGLVRVPNPNPNPPVVRGAWLGFLTLTPTHQWSEGPG